MTLYIYDSAGNRVAATDAQKTAARTDLGAASSTDLDAVASTANAASSAAASAQSAASAAQSTATAAGSAAAAAQVAAAAAYVKPANGIPHNDLHQGIREQLDLADTALQPGVLPAGTTVTATQISDASAAGRAVLTAANEAAQRTAMGLGTAATTAASAYATAAQGVKADAALPATADAIADVLEAAATGALADLARIQSSVSGDVEVSLAALMSHDARPSYLTQIRTAIAANAAKVVFVGDSVTENSDCIDTGALDLHGTYRQIFVEMLSEAFPAVTWTFRHFGLSGRNGGQFIDPAYVGQSGTENTATGFLRTAALHPNWGEGTGSVVGKSWLDHVKDSAPDMLVVAFGLNPEFDVKIRDHLAAIRTAANSWTKVPSLVFITAMRPDTRWQDQYRAQGIARVYRAWARQLGYSIIDVNRANNILRDGFDEQMSQWRMVGDVFDNRWRPEWVTDSGTVAATDDFTRTFGPNSFVRIPMGHGIIPRGHDVSIQVEIGGAMNATTGNTRIYCRAESPYTDPLLCPAWLAAQVSSASARIYEAGTGAGAIGGGAEVGTAYTGTFSTGTIVRLDCIGPRMNLYINGVLRNTALQYSNMRGGDILLGAFGGSGAGGLILKNPRIYAREPGLNTPLLSQTELYGVYDGTASRKMPYGGNGLNHPTSIGVTAMYKPGIQGLVRALIE